MDIKREGSMSLCVVVNKSLNSPYCNDITCTCHKKEKRDIKTPVRGNFTGKSKGIQYESASCKITNVDEQAHLPHNKRRFFKSDRYKGVLLYIRGVIKKFVDCLYKI